MSEPDSQDSKNAVLLKWLEKCDSTKLEFYCFFTVLLLISVVARFNLYPVPNTVVIGMIIAVWTPFVKLFATSRALQYTSLENEEAVSTLLVVVGPMTIGTTAFVSTTAYAKGASILMLLLAAIETPKWVRQNNCDTLTEKTMSTALVFVLTAGFGALALLPILNALFNRYPFLPIETALVALLPSVGLTLRHIHILCSS